MAPYGRGGAGNYEAIQRENEKVNNDLERSHSTAEKAGINYLPPDIAERIEAQYAHTGRGGAGNYYSPRELVENGNFSGAQTSHIREFVVFGLLAFERSFANPGFLSKQSAMAHQHHLRITSSLPRHPLLVLALYQPQRAAEAVPATSNGELARLIAKLPSSRRRLIAGSNSSRRMSRRASRTTLLSLRRRSCLVESRSDFML